MGRGAAGSPARPAGPGGNGESRAGMGTGGWKGKPGGREEELEVLRAHRLRGQRERGTEARPRSGLTRAGPGSGA